MLNNLVLHIRNIFFVFSHCDGWLREFDLVFLIFIILWNRKSWLDNFMLLVTWCAKKIKYEWEYTSEIFYSQEFLGVANNCGQHSLEKNSYFIMRFSPHFQLFYFSDRLEFCEFFEWKIKRINNADLFSQPPLLIFIKGANISGGHCTSEIAPTFAAERQCWPETTGQYERETKPNILI